MHPAVRECPQFLCRQVRIEHVQLKHDARDGRVDSWRIDVSEVSGGNHWCAGHVPANRAGLTLVTLLTASLEDLANRSKERVEIR